MAISCYGYVYGAGMQTNRSIKFYRNLMGELQAEVSAWRGNGWTQTGILNAASITVELSSTSDKVRLLMEARQAHTSPKFDTMSMANMPPTQQDRILTQLEPVGPWRIEISNDIGGPLGLEKVVRLSLFNPS